MCTTVTKIISDWDRQYSQDPTLFMVNKISEYTVRFVQDTYRPSGYREEPFETSVMRRFVFIESNDTMPNRFPRLRNPRFVSSTLAIRA